MNNYNVTLSDIVNLVFCKDIIDKAQNKINEQKVIDCAKSIKDVVEKGNKLTSREEIAASFLLAIDLMKIEENINNKTIKQ